ncbi:hypothetical protein B0B52_13340 [Polaromonas sp. A23]|nr:hypothetical protein B0B52_13340 [Polaromonas sp. A23]
MKSPIPPHRAIELPGLHAYSSRISIAAGDSIGFHVSSTVPYRFSLCQLGPDVDNFSSDIVIHTLECSSPVVQAIHPGSYVAVDQGLPSDVVLDALTLECWIKPWSFEKRQSVISQFDWPHQCGFQLSIARDGGIEFYCGSGGEYEPACLLTGPRLVEMQWTHVVATFDRGALTLWVNGQNAAVGRGPVSCLPGRSPLRLGACAIHGSAEHFLDADLTMPVLYAERLNDAAIRQRYSESGLHAATGNNVLACWPLSEENGDCICDVSQYGRKGRIINHATWMIVGPAFNPAKVNRFTGRTGAYEPSDDPSRGHGLRLASDDLVDCRWTETHRVAIPSDAKPGIYVGRFDFELDGDRMRNDVTFIVKRSSERSAAPCMVLCATNTWLAYSSSPFAKNRSAPATWPRRGVGLPNSHPEAPTYNTYTAHSGGQPTYYAGLRMPWPNASPTALYAPDGSGFSQWSRLERHLHVWLDSHGYDYDVITDLDLHRDPDLLTAYRTVIVNGHSEYWSAPAYQGLDDYLAKGGTAIVLSGNTMYWRVSFNADGTVMEQRKTNTPQHPGEGPGEKHAAPGGIHGEQYHSQDGKRGGLWRFNDRTCSNVIGLESAGWGFASAEDFGTYRVKDAKHFLFHEPFETSLTAGASFGHGPGGSLPRAVGHEWDLTMASISKMTRHIPPDAVLPATQDGIQVIAQGMRPVPGPMDAYMDYFEGSTASLDGLSAEMIYWERPQGGRVFNAGAVGASWVLAVDPHMDALVRNVLHHFGVCPVTTPLPKP